MEFYVKMMKCMTPRPLSVFAAPSHEHIVGSGHSKPTVLEAMIKNFKKGFQGEYGISMTPGK